MKNKTSAFTLIELSAVIVIIGILIAGVMTATVLIAKSKITAAQSLTKASPIPGITDNALWLESSSESSFKETESSTGDLITTWYDQKIAANKSSIVAVGTGPTYSNTINYIHAVKFNGSTNNYLKIADASFLNGTDYTIVVLEKKQAASAGNFLSTTDTSDAVDNKLAIGYASDGVINHSHNSTSYTVAPKVSTYANSTETPRLFVFTQSSTEGRKTYINGTLAAQDTSKTALLSGVTTLAIGKGYTGEIGEIAIFTRALKIEERKATEDYLGKKWTRKLNRNVASIGITGSGRDTSGNPSCLNGTVTDSSSSGCENPCAVNVTGVSTPSSVVDGATGNLTCNNSLGYSGTIAYNCYGGDLHPSPSICTAITCTAAAGTGYAAQTGLAFAKSGSGSFSCDTANGYTGTKNYTCTTTGAATGVATITGGTCTLLTPSNSVPPTLSTTSAIVGTAISVNTGTWSPTPTSYTYAWWRSDGTPVAISGAASSSYTPIAADAGRTLICKVTAINSSGSSASPANSNTTLAVSNPPVNSVAPALSSTSPSVGNSITVTNGTWLPAPTSYTYAWWRSDGTPEAISGATSSSYTPIAADAGRTLICKVTAIGSNGTSLAVSSNASSAVAAFAQCTGGSITTVGSTTIHRFTSSDSTTSLTCSGARPVNIFVVGAGGSGATHQGEYSGGGGGGGIVKVEGFTLPSGTYKVTVGVGGGIGFTTGCGSKGANGGNSEFKKSDDTINVTAYGGGGGGGCGYGYGVTGGSGGGDTCNSNNNAAATKGTTSGIASTSAIITSYGNAGGAANGSCSNTGAGGGGAGGVGGNTSNSNGGNGGAGLTDSISGLSVVYGAGGGGASHSGQGGAAGGLGAGAGATHNNAGTSGSANTGGGGGAGGGDGNNVKGGGDGGSGVVIVTYSNF
jgi:prepilin-type N-terminal cleavage/methylation domain-containing protein